MPGRFRILRIRAAGGVISLRTNRGRLARPGPSGRGPPLVCVHGFVIPGIYMLPLGEQLAPHAVVFIPDLPGYGASSRPRPIPEPVGLAEALIDLLGVLKIPAAHFLGYSYGCQVVAELAARHPDRVGQLVLTGPTVDPQHRSASQQIVRLGLTAFFEKRGLPTLVLRHFLKAGPRTILATLRHCLSHSMETTLPKITAPVLVVRGAHDFVAPQAWAAEVARLAPCGQLAVLSGAAHGLNYSSPLELARVTAPFLDYAWCKTT
jgi:pimeloyl-ACP methyl ester carboxylesterase